MATDFQPPPTYANPILEETDPRTGEKTSKFNPVWLKWFVDLVALIPASGAGSGSVTSIVAGSGLTGGTITVTGTLAVDPNLVLVSLSVTGLGGGGQLLSAGAPNSGGAGFRQVVVPN